jgi:hypothetical protein
LSPNFSKRKNEQINSSASNLLIITPHKNENAEAFMNEMEMLKIVQQFSRKTDPLAGQVKITRVPDYKTVYVEQIGDFGRSIVLSEYTVDGKTYWAGYSTLSETVFISQASRD